jgi:catechol 2,3-dioxygenase-like lactoylglutathione lyase family enzyme
MSPETVSGIAGILTVAVPVADHDRALDFYRGRLGFEVRRDSEFGPGMRWVEVAPPGSQITIALAPVRQGASTGVDTGIRLATANAEATHADLASRGVEVGEVLHMGPAVPPMFFLKDADGNQLVIVEAAGA